MPLLLPNGETRLDLHTPVKFLNVRGESPFAYYPWPLPKGEEPGAWVRVTGRLVLCQHGLHYCTILQAPQWARECLYPLEVSKEYLIHGSTDKMVCRKARLWPHIDTWSKRTALLLSVDYAEHAMQSFPDLPEWDRDAYQKVLDIARLYAREDRRRHDLFQVIVTTLGTEEFNYPRESYLVSAMRALGHLDPFGALRLAFEYSANAAASARSISSQTADFLWSKREEQEWQGIRLLKYLNGEVS